MAEHTLEELEVRNGEHGHIKKRTKKKKLEEGKMRARSSM